MPGEKGSEASSQPLSKVPAPVARERMTERERITEMMRLLREAAKTPRAKASDGASSRAPGEIPKRTVGENHDPAPACLSEAIASAPAENAKRIAEETSGSTETTDDEAVGSPEALPEESEQIEQTLAQTSPDRPGPWEIERQLEPARRLQPTAAQTLARWRDALWEALHGRWSEAGWARTRATWRRVGKAVLRFLARFIPGREPEVLRRSREIQELFRFLHEEPKKPGTWSNCPK